MRAFLVYVRRILEYHGLRGSASPVLTATGFVNVPYMNASSKRVSSLGKN